MMPMDADGANGCAPRCVLCGSGEDAGPGERLLFADSSAWVHLNCALWSSEVYENLNGELMRVTSALQRAPRPGRPNSLALGPLAPEPVSLLALRPSRCRPNRWPLGPRPVRTAGLFLGAPPRLSQPLPWRTASCFCTRSHRPQLTGHSCSA
eukprot:3618000-Prymnesium_polylepis.1